MQDNITLKTQTKKITETIKNVCVFYPKSKMPASTGKKYGKYRFFKSDSSSEKIYCDEYITDGNTIIINDGGVFNVKYFEGKAGYSDHCIAFYTKNEIVCDKYLFYLLEANKELINENGFVGGTLKNIDRKWFNNFSFEIPNIDTQKKVSSFLSYLDLTIEEKKNELEKTLNYKNTMLFKMFPREGYKVPEIRFKGFKSDWNIKNFENSFIKLSNNSIKRDLLNYKTGVVKNIHYGDILIKFGFTVNPKNIDVPFINPDEKINQDRKDYLITGDVVFADTAEDTTAGKVTEIINPDCVDTISGLHTYPCRPLIKCIPGFLGIMLNTNYFHDQLVPYMQGTKVTGFNYSHLCKTKITYPCENEQKKIVDFFHNLDTKIINQKKEISILENCKKTLLFKIFA